jgi:hypothetical protein
MCTRCSMNVIHNTSQPTCGSAQCTIENNVHNRVTMHGCRRSILWIWAERVTAVAMAPSHWLWTRLATSSAPALSARAPADFIAYLLCLFLLACFRCTSPSLYSWQAVHLLRLSPSLYSWQAAELTKGRGTQVRRHLAAEPVAQDADPEHSQGSNGQEGARDGSGQARRRSRAAVQTASHCGVSVSVRAACACARVFMRAYVRACIAAASQITMYPHLWVLLALYSPVLPSLLTITHFPPTLLVISCFRGLCIFSPAPSLRSLPPPTFPLASHSCLTFGVGIPSPAHPFASVKQLI